MKKFILSFVVAVFAICAFAPQASANQISTSTHQQVSMAQSSETVIIIVTDDTIIIVIVR